MHLCRCVCVREARKGFVCLVLWCAMERSKWYLMYLFGYLKLLWVVVEVGHR